MIKFGQVQAYDKTTGEATIVYMRPDACAKCGACGGGGKSRSIRLKADCAVGDWVKVELPDGRFLGATALAYALPLACFLLGLFLGLKMPNLSWTNEVVPIKQSACVALSLFSGWAVAMIPGALYLLTGIGSLDPLLYLSVVTALVLILSAVLSLWVKKTGSCIFAAL